MRDGAERLGAEVGPILARTFLQWTVIRTVPSKTRWSKLGSSLL